MKTSYFERTVTGDLTACVHLVPNHATVETINYACDAYGFLIERGEKLTTRQFAERIAKHYDCGSVPQNRAVVAALGACI